MVRCYKRKTTNYSNADIVEALTKLKYGQSIRKVSAQFKIPKSTLQLYIAPLGENLVHFRQNIKYIIFPKFFAKK